MSIFKEMTITLVRNICLNVSILQDALGAMVDEVEAFTLDEDFDYDNVILTPKFTMEERKYLDELASRGRQVKQVTVRWQPYC